MNHLLFLSSRLLLRSEDLKLLVFIITDSCINISMPASQVFSLAHSFLFLILSCFLHHPPPASSPRMFFCLVLLMIIKRGKH
jgi:hypothetical protein